MALKLTIAHCNEIQAYARRLAGEIVIVAVTERTDGKKHSFNLLQFEEGQHDMADKTWLKDARGIDLDFGEGTRSELDCCYYERDSDGEVGDLVDYFNVTLERVNNKAVIIELG